MITPGDRVRDTENAMSEANVEIAKRVIDAFNRRDVEGFIALAASDFEWFPAMAGGVSGGGYVGRNGIETYLADTVNAYRMRSDGSYLRAERSRNGSGVDSHLRSLSRRA